MTANEKAELYRNLAEFYATPSRNALANNAMYECLRRGYILIDVTALGRYIFKIHADAQSDVETIPNYSLSADMALNELDKYSQDIEINLFHDGIKKRAEIKCGEHSAEATALGFTIALATAAMSLKCKLIAQELSNPKPQGKIKND